MSSWHSYPSIFALGHAAVRDLLTVPHFVQEKVDGSQFSFGRFLPSTADVDAGLIPDECELRVRSKGAVMHPDAPEKMFTRAVESVKERQHLLHPGWTYRGEYLQKPKHNALAYDRVPNGHIILFDVSTGEEEWLDPLGLLLEAERIELEAVPMLAHGGGDTAAITLDELRTILDTTQSVLGGQLIEGVVVKPFRTALFGRDKKTLMGKFVSERFKEVHSREWTKENPTNKDIIGIIGDQYTSAARWQKAVQHLREAGKITDSPQDIGLLIKEVPEDILKEEEQAIKDALFKHAWPHIRRMVTRGLPEFYKSELLKRQFEQ